MDKINQAKRVPMPSVLQALGIPCPDKKAVIRSPFRADEQSSFSVFKKDERWFFTDHGTGDFGSNIDLVMQLKSLSFSEAVDYLLSDFSFPCDSMPSMPKKKESKKEQVAFLDDNSMSKIYLKNRGISSEVIAACDFKTIEITKGKYKNLYAAFPTHGGGYTCRATDGNPVKCRFIGEADLWTFGNPKSKDVFVFESAIDALSLLTMYGLPKIRLILYVSLNSINNVNLLDVDTFEGKNLFLFLDNDKAGNTATKKIVEAHGKNAKDYREDLQGQKDVSDFLTKVFLPAERR